MIIEIPKHAAGTVGWVARLLQLAFPREGNLNFPWEKSLWDNTVAKRWVFLSKQLWQRRGGCFLGWWWVGGWLGKLVPGVWEPCWKLGWMESPVYWQVDVLFCQCVNIFVLCWCCAVIDIVHVIVKWWWSQNLWSDSCVLLLENGQIQWMRNLVLDRLEVIGLYVSYVKLVQTLSCYCSQNNWWHVS